MNFMEAVQSCFKNYATGAGRASRSEYWYWALFHLIGGFICGVVDHAIFSAAPGKISPLFLLWRIALFAPSLAVAVRRLHDVNRPWQWLLIGLTIIGLIYPLLVWNCTKGTDGPNRFGSDPLAVRLSSRAS